MSAETGFRWWFISDACSKWHWRLKVSGRRREKANGRGRACETAEFSTSLEQEIRTVSLHASIAPSIHSKHQNHPPSPAAFFRPCHFLFKARYPVSQCKTPVDDHLLSCLAVLTKHHHLINNKEPQLPPSSIHPLLPPPPFDLSQQYPHLLPPERAPLRQSRLATRRLAQHGRAAAADDDGLGVREDGCDGEAAGAFDVHEEGAGGGYEGLARCFFGVS